MEFAKTCVTANYSIFLTKQRKVNIFQIPIASVSDLISTLNASSRMSWRFSLTKKVYAQQKPIQVNQRDTSVKILPHFPQVCSPILAQFVSPVFLLISKSSVAQQRVKQAQIIYIIELINHPPFTNYLGQQIGLEVTKPLKSDIKVMKLPSLGTSYLTLNSLIYLLVFGVLFNRSGSSESESESSTVGLPSLPYLRFTIN